jgi:hypothetical protein
MRKLIFPIFLCQILVSGCMNLSYEPTPSTPGSSVLEASHEYWVDMELVVGNVSLSGKVHEHDNHVNVDWAVGIKYIQIISLVNLDKDVQPDYLRVIYTSNRIEWVGTWDAYVYDDEDKCIEEGNYCDPVIPAEGVSGVFYSGGEHIGVSNAHCSISNYDYSYDVSAYIIDISGPDPVRVSDVMQITIICIQII